MSIFKKEDLEIVIGLEAYEKFTGERVPNREISVIKYGYSPGVYIKHIPTGLEAYSNEYKAQVKNKDLALADLEELLRRRKDRDTFEKTLI